MDPLSIIGAVAACTELVKVIAKVATNIAALKRQWADGARTLQLLIGKLSTIRAALAQIKDWSDFNYSTSPSGEEMRDSLAVAIEGCTVIMEALDRDVAGLLGDSVVSRFRQFFFESAIREYEERLDSQIVGLQLLITAAYASSQSEQTSLLRQTAARQVFQRIRDDTSTVREQSTIREAERTAASVAPAPVPEVETDSHADYDPPPIPRPSRDSRRIDSFPYAESSVGFNSMPHEAEDEGWNRRDSGMPRAASSTRQRPTPFEMLPYQSSSSTSTSPMSDTNYTTNTSLFSSPSKPRSTSPSTSPSLSTAEFKPPSSIRQRLSKLGLMSMSKGHHPDDVRAMSPKSQLSLRSPGALSATDMYLHSEGGQPPPKPIVAAQRGDHGEMASLIRRRANINQPHRESGRTPLAVACHCGHDEVVGLLIAEGANVNARDKRGLSPLHLAAANGHCNVIESLLSREVDINARSASGKTPLRVACEHGQLSAVRVLAKHRANIDHRDQEQKTPLHIASETGDDDVVGLLLQCGASKDAKDYKMRTPLHSACIFGRVRVAEILINAKADIEAREEENLTPLAAAARSGLTVTMELLLRHKASPRTRGAGDFTALHWASYYGHEEAVNLLVSQKKIELDAQSINGRTSLHVAAMTASFGVMEKLIRAGASIEAQCHKQDRPLHYACRHATHSEVSLLLNAGADCNAANSNYETPLHISVRAGSAKVVKALLARGVVVDATDEQGVRPLAIGCSEGHLEITNLLLSHGARVSGVTDAPVCLAASGGHVQVIQALLQRGGAVRETDAQGWEPLRRAAFAGHVEAVACLLGRGARATDLGPLGSFIFSSTAGTEQLDRIRALLSAALESEDAEYQRVSYLATAFTPPSTNDVGTGAVGRNLAELPQNEPDDREPESPRHQRRRGRGFSFSEGDDNNANPSRSSSEAQVPSSPTRPPPPVPFSSANSPNNNPLPSPYYIPAPTNSNDTSNDTSTRRRRNGSNNNQYYPPPSISSILESSSDSTAFGPVSAYTTSTGTSAVSPPSPRTGGYSVSSYGTSRIPSIQVSPPTSGYYNPYDTYPPETPYLSYSSQSQGGSSAYGPVGNETGSPTHPAELY